MVPGVRGGGLGLAVLCCATAARDKKIICNNLDIQKRLQILFETRDLRAPKADDVTRIN
jgi:hypothetical protein